MSHFERKAEEYEPPAEATIRTAGPGGNPFFDIS